ncbi:RlpA-like double-psi beta-barrel-protein domain-containing protein-containing protein [Hypoxylon rubiginosum]|uniref:RlpA-like double-psi beta-barrel-protein domain-containing protein-containing protein n=1 Tax=Hypoxylon rubiginosum TaxID=110542 RepID=A0ACC0DJS2_9PEZI|nr:RlpA-like double-psi beta-barrel-protein domain-containing protein-containing protein [Hypoxylon rubiginosum]
MADHSEDGRPAATEPVYQLPEWETITHPPKPRQSLLGRILPARAAEDKTVAMSARPSTTAELDRGKEMSDPASTLPLHTATTPENGAQKPTLLVGLRKSLDSVLPPHRTYFGRSRRFLFLYILLPAAIFIFVVIPLAVGLGVGLSRRHSAAKQENLPLPSNTGIFTGELTYYDPALGACGMQSSSSEDIVSVSHIIFDAASVGSDPNANPLCGRTIRVTRDYVEAEAGNRSVDVTVVDRCVGCAATDLDLSIAVFTRLAPQESGRVLGSWAWL